MDCYITGIFAGYIALDENFNLIDYELFPKDKLQEKYLMHLNGQMTLEEDVLINKMLKKEFKIIIETKKPISKYNEHYNESNIITYAETPAGKFIRANMDDLLLKVGFLNLSDDLRKIMHDLSLSIVEEQLRKTSRADDLILIQAINAMEDVEESEGKLLERLREWYPIHFPELDQVKDHSNYVDLIAQYGDRKSILSSGKIHGEIKNSIGVDLSSEDIKMLQDYALTLQSLQKTKKSLKKYIETKMEEIAPNLMELTSASLGAKLIAHTGSIKRLAMLPSSTVQIIGAEKALFRHLKTGENPPKHGLIYQHPAVRGSKWWIRGKIARKLASKISLAVRMDFFSGTYDPSILEDFTIQVTEIEKSNPFPKRITKKKKTSKKKKKSKKKFSKKELNDLY